MVRFLFITVLHAIPAVLTASDGPRSELNDLVADDPTKCYQRDAARFRVEFYHVPQFAPRVSAGNTRDYFPRRGDGYVRVGPDSDMFPYRNGDDFTPDHMGLLFQRILNFPRTKKMPVWTKGSQVIPDEFCDDDVEPVETQEFVADERFELKDADTFTRRLAQSFHIDLWVSGDGKPMAQFSGDWRRGKRRLFSRYGLKPHDSLGIHEYIPRLNGFPLEGANLEVFYKFVQSFRTYYEKIVAGEEAQFVVCARPYKTVSENPYFDKKKLTETYLFFPESYCP